MPLASPRRAIALAGGTAVPALKALPMNETGAADRIFFGADVMQWKGAATEVIDLKGRTLLPGFLDGHSHFINAVRMAKWANVSAPPVGNARTIADLIGILKEKKAQLALKPGEWLMGYGYDVTAMDESRDLTRADLDAHF